MAKKDKANDASNATVDPISESLKFGTRIIIGANPTIPLRKENMTHITTNPIRQRQKLAFP